VDDIAFAIECTGPELYLLGSMLGAQLMIGVEDPFADPFLDVNATLAAAEARLLERGYLERLPDGGIALDGLIGVMIEVATFPDLSVVAASATSDGDPIQRTYHLQGSLGVEIAPNGDDYRLTTFDGLDELRDLLLTTWAIDGRSAADGSPASVTQGALQEAARLALESDETAAQAFLQRSGVDGETAASLATTLATTDCSGAFTALQRGEFDWRGAGLAVLGGDNGLWRLRSVERDAMPCLEIAPCDATTLADDVRAVLGCIGTAQTGETNVGAREGVEPAQAVRS
jgi:hypothetical protein